MGEKISKFVTGDVEREGALIAVIQWHCLPSPSVGLGFGVSLRSWTFTVSFAGLSFPYFSVSSHLHSDSNASMKLFASHFLLVLRSRNSHP